MSSPILVDHAPRGAAHVTLDRPAVHNAFDEDTIAQLHSAFAALTADPAVRVIVLGATGQTFCAGADIGWMQRAAANSQAANLEDARRFAAMLWTLADCPKPVVARIQGAAYGGGVGLACAADIVLASERARFCVSEARFGILPAVIGPYLAAAVGVRQARRLALTMQVLPAAEALALGLVHEVVPADGLDSAVERTVEQLLAGGPAALAEIKALFAQLSAGPITAEARELTAQTISRVRATAEAREGFAAFAEKRDPAWRKAE